MPSCPDVEEVVESVDQVSETPAPVPADAVVELSVGDIDPNRNQPRKKFDDDALLALGGFHPVTTGVLSPILVARDGRRYTIIAGERRWRAARLANCPDHSRQSSATGTMCAVQEAALVENIQREDLNAIEEARGIRRLMEECALTQEVAAERIGRSRSAVANILRLLNLPKRIQDAVIEGTLSAGHARVLAGIDDAELQSSLFAKTMQFGWSVRQLEAAAKNAQTEKKEKPEPVALPIEYEELTERLRRATGLKVKLEGTQEKGKIVLQYTSEEELQRLWEGWRSKRTLWNLKNTFVCP